MKCLAVGMNPNYVLSEDERRRRFKKRNNSVNEKEKTNGVSVIRSLTVESLVGNLELKNMSYNKETSQNRDLKEILEKRKENLDSQVVSSTDTEMKRYKNFPLKNEINFPPNIPAYTPDQQGMTNETRGSIIIENSTSHHITEHLGQKKAFLDAEYKKSVKKRI